MANIPTLKPRLKKCSLYPPHELSHSPESAIAMIQQTVPKTQ